MKGIRGSYEDAHRRVTGNPHDPDLGPAACPCLGCASWRAHEAQLVDGCDPNRLEIMEGIVRRAGVSEAEVRATAVGWVKAGAPLATVRMRIVAGEKPPTRS